MAAKAKAAVRRSGSAALTKAKELAASAKRRAASSAAKARVWSGTDKGKRTMAGLGAAAVGALTEEVGSRVADEYPEANLWVGLGLVAAGTLITVVAKQPAMLAAGGAVAGIGGVRLAAELKDMMADKADPGPPAARTQCASDLVRLDGVRQGAPSPWGAMQAQQRLQGVYQGPPTPQGAAINARMFR